MSPGAKLIFLTILCYFTAKAPTQAESQILSLSISVPEQSIRIGSEVKVKTILTNVTDHVVNLSDSNRDCDYAAQVFDSKGNAASETTYKQRLRCDKGQSDGRMVVVALKPHESKQDEIVLSRLYSLKPGRYEIQIARVIATDPDKRTVKSNIITITLTE